MSGSGSDSPIPTYQYIKTSHYLAKLQPVLNEVLEKVAVDQPSDPIPHLIDSLQHVSPTTLSHLRDSLQAMKHDDLAKQNIEGPNHIEITLLLTLNPGASIRGRVFEILKELQSHAKTQGKCWRFDICSNPNNPDEILVLQSWPNQHLLDQYYKSDAFASATPKFAGLLAGPPQEQKWQIATE